VTVTSPADAAVEPSKVVERAMSKRDRSDILNSSRGEQINRTPTFIVTKLLPRALRGASRIFCANVYR
jgi:hypothetical protein